MSMNNSTNAESVLHDEDNHATLDLGWAWDTHRYIFILWDGVWAPACIAYAGTYDNFLNKQRHMLRHTGYIWNLLATLLFQRSCGKGNKDMGASYVSAARYIYLVLDGSSWCRRWCRYSWTGDSCSQFTTCNSMRCTIQRHQNAMYMHASKNWGWRLLWPKGCPPQGKPCDLGRPW